MAKAATSKLPRKDGSTKSSKPSGKSSSNKATSSSSKPSNSKPSKSSGQKKARREEAAPIDYRARAAAKLQAQTQMFYGSMVVLFIALAAILYLFMFGGRPKEPDQKPLTNTNLSKENKLLGTGEGNSNASESASNSNGAANSNAPEANNAPAANNAAANNAPAGK